MTHKDRSILKPLLGLTLALFTSLSAYAFDIGEVDQSNPGPFELTNGAFAPFSFGQSFAPTLTSVNSFEFLLGGDDAYIHVNLREGLVGLDGMEGAILAQSADVFIDLLGSNLFTFALPTTVELVPGQTYVAELVIDSGSLGVRHTENNAYLGGQFLHQGYAPSVFANQDLVFAEGISTPVPEPGSWILLCVAGPFLLLHSARRRSNRTA